MIIAVVPFKASRPKSRLAPALDEHARLQLAESMLNHVLRQLRSSPFVDGILAVSANPVDGVETIADPGDGLNPAVRAGLKAAFDRDASEVLVVPADLPYLAQSDLRAIHDAAVGVSGVVAPSKDGGTGALLMRRERQIEPEFGEDSGERHVSALSRTGLAPAVVHRSGLAVDIDVPADLDLLGDELVDIV